MVCKYVPYPLECNPKVLFFVIGVWVRFFSNLTYLGLYLRWGSIIQMVNRTYFNSTSLLLFIKLIDIFVDLIFINLIFPSRTALRKYQSWSEQQEILIDIKSFKIFSIIALDLTGRGCIQAGLV